MTGLVITRADRQEAWPFRQSCYTEQALPFWLDGEYDICAPVIQAFARHRDAEARRCAAIMQRITQSHSLPGDVGMLDRIEATIDAAFAKRFCAECDFSTHDQDVTGLPELRGIGGMSNGDIGTREALDVIDWAIRQWSEFVLSDDEGDQHNACVVFEQIIGKLREVKTSAVASRLRANFVATPSINGDVEAEALRRWPRASGAGIEQHREGLRWAFRDGALFFAAYFAKIDGPTALTPSPLPAERSGADSPINVDCPCCGAPKGEACRTIQGELPPCHGRRLIASTAMPTPQRQEYDGEAVGDAAQRLQDHMEQHHGVCLSASEWDAAILAALAHPAQARDEPESLDRFIFEWFNERDPKAMQTCLEEYDARSSALSSDKGEER